MAFVKAWQAAAFAGVVLVVASELVGKGDAPGLAADLASSGDAAAAGSEPAPELASDRQPAAAPAGDTFDFAEWVDEGEANFAPAPETRDAEDDGPARTTQRRASRAWPSAPAPSAAAIVPQERRNLSPDERARLVQPAMPSPADSEQRLLRDLTKVLD